MNEHLARAIINFLSITILGYMIKNNGLLDNKQRRSLLHVVLAVSVAIIAEAVTVSFVSPIGWHLTVSLVFNAIGFGISPFVPLLMARAFDRQMSKTRLVYYFPATINLVLSLLSPLYGFIYHHSLANDYFRGPFFYFYVFSYLFGIVCFLISTLRHLNVYQNRNKPVLFGLVLLTLVGTSIQVIWSEIPSSWSTVTLVIILGYTYYNELLEQHDIMTNLFNRRAYAQHLTRFAKEGHGSIILFDVDDFKEINDRYGHQYGDACLQLVATNLRDSFAQVGPGYRIGGDEFCVLSTCTEEKTLQKAQSNFLETMARARSADPRIPWVSFGHAFYDAASSKVEEVTTIADQQLYRYKKQRKSQQGVKHL